MNRCKKEGLRLRRTAAESQGQRLKDKLLGKSSWFRKTKTKEQDKRGSQSKGKDNKGGGAEVQARTVLFVEQTPGGELAARLRELLTRLEPLLGFKVKVAERWGRTIQSHFPLNNLWSGTKCGREDCVTCEQEGAEELPDCSRKSVLYENICAQYIPSAGSKGGPKKEDKEPEMPALYVGETSRSINERSREHRAGFRGAKEDNHIVKHQHIAHGGAKTPRFIMRVVSQHRTALGRQVSEAVRIRRRGGEGAVLNSKAEFNRCYIPRLRLEDREETEKREREIKAQDKLREQTLEKEQGDWERKRTKDRDQERKDLGWKIGPPPKYIGEQKAEQGSPSAKRKKSRKLDLNGEDWGAAVLEGQAKQ